MISSSSAWKVRSMAANTSSLEVCFAGPKIACSLRSGRMQSHKHFQGLPCLHIAEPASCTVGRLWQAALLLQDCKQCYL